MASFCIVETKMLDTVFVSKKRVYNVFSFLTVLPYGWFEKTGPV